MAGRTSGSKSENRKKVSGRIQMPGVSHGMPLPAPRSCFAKGCLTAECSALMPRCEKRDARIMPRAPGDIKRSAAEDTFDRGLRSAHKQQRALRPKRHPPARRRSAKCSPSCQGSIPSATPLPQLISTTQHRSLPDASGQCRWCVLAKHFGREPFLTNRTRRAGFIQVVARSADIRRQPPRQARRHHAPHRDSCAQPGGAVCETESKTPTSDPKDRP